MATTSTVLTVEDELVTLWDAALDVPVYYAWPGPNTPADCVFLGRHPAAADILLDVSGEDPVIKAGRRQNQEEYEVVATVWSFRPDLGPKDARTAAGAAHAVMDDMYDVWADNVRLGLASILRTEWRGFERRLYPFQSGWACELRVRVGVSARLT